MGPMGQRERDAYYPDGFGTGSVAGHPERTPGPLIGARHWWSAFNRRPDLKLLSPMSSASGCYELWRLHEGDLDEEVLEARRPDDDGGLVAFKEYVFSRFGDPCARA